MKRITQNFVSPVFADDEEKTRNARLLNIITISSFFSALAYSLIAPAGYAIYSRVGVGLTLIVWLVMQRGHIRAASIMLVAGVNILIAGLVIAAGGVNAPEYGGLIVPILFAGLLLGWRVTVSLTIFSVLFGAVLIQADSLSLLPEPSPHSPALSWSINSIYFILAGIFLTLALQMINDALRGAKRELSERRQIERERENLISELETKNEESETLRESLSSIVGTLEFSQIIENILDQIKRVVPYDSASIWRVEGNVQKYIAGRYVPPEIAIQGAEFPIDEGNSASPILNGKLPYILNHDVQAQLKDFQEAPHTYVQSWLAIPLKTRGQIIGLIALDGKEKNQFNEHHAELAVIFANQVAIALENSRLFSELQSELTERKQAEAELRQRESILEDVADAANLFLQSSDWTLEIDVILEKLGKTINASHAYLFENHSSEDGVKLATMRFEWTAPGYPSDLEKSIIYKLTLERG